MSWQRLNIGSRVNREVHARFWEQPEVKSLRLTRLERRVPRDPNRWIANGSVDPIASTGRPT